MLISTNPDYEPFIYSWEDVERIPVRILGPGGRTESQILNKNPLELVLRGDSQGR